MNMWSSIEEYYRMIVDCWRLFKKFRMPQKSIEFWQELHDEAYKIYSQHGSKIFVKQLLFVMLDEIDCIWEMMKKAGY